MRANLSLGKNRAQRRSPRTPYQQRLHIEPLEDRRVLSLSAGSLDPTFGDDGLVTTDFSNTRDAAHDAAVQADGKIIVAGSTRNRDRVDTDFALARYNPDGTLDATFGDAGQVITKFSDSDRNEVASAVLLQDDGKILAFGNDGSVFNLPNRLVLARYNSDGSLDQSFDADGKVSTFVGSGAEVHDVAIQDDRIVVAGRGGAGDLVVARYHLDGSLDDLVTADFGGVMETAQLQPDGKIVVGGYEIVTSGNDSERDFALARYSADGSADTSFGQNGVVTTDLGGFSEWISSLAIQPDGKIVAAGPSAQFGLGQIFAMARYDAEGKLDRSFGTSGEVTTPDLLEPHAVVLQTSGRIVIVDRGSDFRLARFTRDGQLDTSFDGDGIATADFGGFDESFNAAIQPDGQIVVVGTARLADFGLARFQGVDPSDAALNTTVQLVADVQNLVAEGVLNNGQGNSLLAKLQAAIEEIDAGHTASAANLLAGFVNQVNQFITDGVLTPEQGQPLVDDANEAIAVLTGHLLTAADTDSLDEPTTMAAAETTTALAPQLSASAKPDNPGKGGGSGGNGGGGGEPAPFGFDTAFSLGGSARDVAVDADNNFYVAIAPGDDRLLAKYDAAASLQWEARFLSGYASPYDVVVGPSGDVYVAGYFHGEVDFGGTVLTGDGSPDGFVARIDADTGAFIWASGFGAELSDFSTALAVSSDRRVHVTGRFADQVQFGDITLNSSVGLWVSSGFGVRDGETFTVDDGTDVVTFEMEKAEVGDGVAPGNVAIVFNEGQSQSEIAGLVAQAVEQHTKATGTPLSVWAYIGNAESVTHTPLDPTDPSLRIDIQQSAFLADLDGADGTFLSAELIPGRGLDTEGSGVAVHETADETAVYVSGWGDQEGGPATPFVWKRSSIDGESWVQRLGGSGAGGTGVFAIAVDAQGNVLTTGTYTGTVDFDPGDGVDERTSKRNQGVVTSDIFVWQLGSDGAHHWVAAMDGPGASYDAGYDIAVDADGNVYTTGRFVDEADFDPGKGRHVLTAYGEDDINPFSGTNRGTSDVFISKLDANGKFVWAANVGGDGASWSADSGNGIALDGTDSVIVAGSFLGTGDFDPTDGQTILSGGGGFVLKLTQPSASGASPTSLLAASTDRANALRAGLAGLRDEKAPTVTVDRLVESPPSRPEKSPLAVALGELDMVAVLDEHDEPVTTDEFEPRAVDSLFADDNLVGDLLVP